MNREDASSMLEDALSDCLVNGIGVIVLVNTPKGPEFKRVPFPEYLDLADVLIHTVQSVMDFTPNPPKR